MSAAARRLLLVLGLGAVALLLFLLLPEHVEEGGPDLATPPAGEVGAPEDPPPPVPADPGDPPAAQPRAKRVPRILPPDAAVEDVRDALAREGEARRAALQSAFDALARLARKEDDTTAGVRRYLREVEDPLARGVVLAALGADRDAGNLAWLARRLRQAPSDVEGLGAFLGLAHDPKGEGPVHGVAAFHGVRLAVGALPDAEDVLAAVAGWIDRAGGRAPGDAARPLLEAVRRDVRVAALLVVGGERPVRLLAEVDVATRGRLREAALAHDGLPGAVRRVLEAE